MTNPLVITQGDAVSFLFTALQGNNMPYDLTEATFTTLIRGNGGTTISFPNSQHTANPDQVNFKGQYTLTLSSSDTLGLLIGQNKEIITQIVISTLPVYFHGANILTVLPAVPMT